MLEHAIPQTLQDVVLIYASVTGTKEGEFFEESYVKFIWSTGQALVGHSGDHRFERLLRDGPVQAVSTPPGFVTQESILLNDFLANDFGVYFR